MPQSFWIDREDTLLILIHCYQIIYFFLAFNTFPEPNYGLKFHWIKNVNFTICTLFIFGIFDSLTLIFCCYQILITSDPFTLKNSFLLEKGKRICPGNKFWISFSAPYSKSIVNNWHISSPILWNIVNKYHKFLHFLQVGGQTLQTGTGYNR